MTSDPQRYAVLIVVALRVVGTAVRCHVLLRRREDQDQQITTARQNFMKVAPLIVAFKKVPSVQAMLNSIQDSIMIIRSPRHILRICQCPLPMSI